MARETAAHLRDIEADSSERLVLLRPVLSAHIGEPVERGRFDARAGVRIAAGLAIFVAVAVSVVQGGRAGAAPAERVIGLNAHEQDENRSAAGRGDAGSNATAVALNHSVAARGIEDGSRGAVGRGDAGANATAVTFNDSAAGRGHEEQIEAPAVHVPGQGKHDGCEARPEGAAQRSNSTSGKRRRVELWGQCGGTDWNGLTECEAGLMCVGKKLKTDVNFKQCRPDPNSNVCKSAEGNKDMKCWYKVTWDMTKGIYVAPGMYHGLTPQSSWEEFQEQNFNYLHKKSGCPQPCAPKTGEPTCYEVLHIEGCDDSNEWSCEKDDDSLAFACCCKKYHPDVTTRVLESQQVQAKEEASGPSFFCIALIMPRSYEVDLMRMQFDHGLGIFDSACDEWAVVSNETLSMNCKSDAEEYDTLVMPGSLEAPKGGQYGTTMNTQVFRRMWDSIIADPRPWAHDFVVKVDPDCLFFPGRLKSLLSPQAGLLSAEEPAGGVYINNCFLGLHGPIEVFSKKALGNYNSGKKKCVDGDPGKHGQEDWFLRECFKLLHVEKVDAYNILMEGENACKEKPSAWDPDRPPCFAPEAAFHPFKTRESMLHCWAEATSHHVANPLRPVTDAPSGANNRHG